MVLITRKKCNISVDMPTRCFKLCTNCKTRKKKVQNITDTTIVDESIPTFDILNIFYLISEISTYLTAYEVWCLYRTCTEFKNILSDKKIWSAILERDYTDWNRIGRKLNKIVQQHLWDPELRESRRRILHNLK